MTTFEYSGPFSVETINKKDIVFKDGLTYEDLPENDKRVKTLINIGRLKPIKRQKIETAPEIKPEQKNNKKKAD